MNSENALYSNELSESPVAIFIFNRPDATKKLVEAIQHLKIPLLFVVADGPRLDRTDDELFCAKAREIIDAVKWGCEVRRLYRPENLGCGLSPAQGLDWIFSQVDRCIILEDDCIPNPTFFQYCNELLEIYAADNRIMMISGNNYLLNKHCAAESYLFSIHTQTHGWATWRRAWAKYDFHMRDWPKVRSLAWLNHFLGDRGYAKFWQKNFDRAYYESNSNLQCSFWDYQWIYACWKNNGLNIIPSVNLISNIGFGETATHTFQSDSPLANLASHSIQFPLLHPPAIVRDYVADEVLGSTSFGYESMFFRFTKKLTLKIKAFLNHIYGN